MTIRCAMAAFSLLFLVAATIILMRSLRPLPLSKRLLYLLFPLSQLFILAFLLYYLLIDDLPLWLFGIVAFTSVLCGVGDIFLFKALRAAEEKDLAEERVRILENQTALQKEYLERLAADAEDTENTRKAIADELKKIAELLDEQEAAQAEAQIQKTADLLGAAGKRFCSHPIIDALMIMKADACEAAQIRLTCDLSVPEGLAFSGVDLCAVFSNVVDNAIRGCQDAGVDDPHIRLKAGVQKGYFLLNAENSCARTQSKRPFSKDPIEPGKGLPAHGWGLQILEGIARRHDGSLKTEQNNTVYRTSIALKLDALEAPDSFESKEFQVCTNS